jgi:hypothetical protein
VSVYRIIEEHFTPKHHLGFEFAAWYWHFVDVVWLLLFLVFYIWGSIGRQNYILTYSYFLTLYPFQIN